MNILIVDDDPVCRRVLKAIVASEPGHQITEAIDGAEAWALLDNPSRFFDVVLLDISMPEPDGIEILRRIHESQILRSVRVVMCTAANDRETVAKVIQLGGRHYIVKPAAAPRVHAKLKQLQAEIVAESAPRRKFAGIASG